MVDIASLNTAAICDKCGACCRTFPVLVSISDAQHEQRIYNAALVRPPWLQTQEHYFQLHPLPFHEACAFLGSDNLCQIYNSRPHVCRRFAAGSEECQEARKRVGLPELV